MRRLGTELLRRVRRGRPVCLAGKHDDDSPDHDEQPHNRYDEQHDDYVAYDYDSADDHDDGHGSEPHHDNRGPRLEFGPPQSLERNRAKGDLGHNSARKHQACQTGEGLADDSPTTQWRSVDQSIARSPVSAR